nr:STAS domain-containing protein [candidate division Zixibacteria bacterium]
MKMTDDFRDGVAIIALEGRIMGGRDATMFHGKVYEYLNGGFKKLVIDLGKTKWMDSIGMGMLISAMTAVTKNSGSMKIVNVTDNIKSLLTITRLVSVFETHDSLDDAINSFNPAGLTAGTS